MATSKELKAQAKAMGLKGYSNLKVDELEALIREAGGDPGAETATSGHKYQPWQREGGPEPKPGAPCVVCGSRAQEGCDRSDR